MGEATTCASGVSAPVDGRIKPPAQVAMGETTMCASGVFVVRYKVQRSGCKVQRSGPASAQVGAGCSNNMGHGCASGQCQLVG